VAAARVEQERLAAAGREQGIREAEPARGHALATVDAEAVRVVEEARAAAGRDAEAMRAEATAQVGHDWEEAKARAATQTAQVIADATARGAAALNWLARRASA
jgi:hypothetical protein